MIKYHIHQDPPRKDGKPAARHLRTVDLVPVESPELAREMHAVNPIFTAGTSIGALGLLARTLAELLAKGAAISSPEGRLHYGLFWFMNLTATDAKALAALARDGNLLDARQIWEEGEQNMSSLQNQLMCCLLKDPRSYSKALQIALSLYTKYAREFILTVSNGFNPIYSRCSDANLPCRNCQVLRW